MKQPDPGKPIVLTDGPRTEEGRAISSRNATKHGCCSTEILILASESHDEFKSLKSVWFQTYQPKLEAEIHLVDQLVEADWFSQRATRRLPPKPRRTHPHPNSQRQSRQTSHRRSESQNLSVQTRAHQLAREAGPDAPTIHLARLHPEGTEPTLK